MRTIIIITSTIILLWILINIDAWRNCTFDKRGYFSKSKEEAINSNSILAAFATKIKSDRRTIWVERVQIKYPWKYIFYTPKFYDKTFFVNRNSVPEVKYIMVGKDTALREEGQSVCPLNELPNELKVQFKNDTTTVNFYLVERYQENIDHIATVPFYKKIDSGPFLKD